MFKIENVDCPMMRKNIEIAYCIELRMIVANEIKPSDSEKHLCLEDYKKCKQCKIRQEMED